MQLEIRFKSIAVRWFLNIFLIVAAVIVVAVVAFSALFSSIYTERIEVLATDYAYEFYALSGTDSKTFKDTAVEIAGEFQYKNKIEVQVIDLNGQILVSTSGFQSENEPMPDYYKAKEDGSSSVLKSTTLDGEPIMAGTTVIYGSQGEKLGA